MASVTKKCRHCTESIRYSSLVGFPEKNNVWKTWGLEKQAGRGEARREAAGSEEEEEN